MVAFRVGDVQMVSLDDGAFGSVLEAAAQAGGPDQYPILFSLPGANDAVDPLAVVDELARLGAAPEGASVGVLIAMLRDDLMEALAASEEG